MFHIGYKAVGTFLEDGYPAINCLRLVEDVEETWKPNRETNGKFGR